MHPSKAHQSTTKEPDSGLRLGFSDINGNGGDQPSGVTQKSPSKTGISSSFDFRFARPGPELGEDAQRLMDELREEAMKIKAHLAKEREDKRQAEEEEQQQRADEGQAVSGRRIAQPKGKAGRYSDVHMAEFKKMDSIAGHASAFRAQPGRFAPAAQSLKRTQSKANLDSREESNTKSMQPAHKPEGSERLENTAPAKRARKAIADDTSSARPISRSGVPVPSTPKQARSSAFLDAITTPTQASLARTTSTKGPTSQIPTLSKSPSKPNLLNGTPGRLQKSATLNNVSSLPKSASKIALKSPGRFERVRSILRHVSPSHKKSAAKQSSIPSLSRSPSKPNFDKALPSVPTTPVAAKTVKNINFTPDTTKKTSAAAFQNSPSPQKSGIPRSKSNRSMKSSALPSDSRIAYPNIASNPDVVTKRPEVEYPSLTGVRPLPPIPHAESSRPPPSVPGTFTFRSDHTIDFGASPKSFGSSSGQASIRQVRPSVSHSMPGSFPGSNKENTEPLPAVPHGIVNKKRRRAESDDTEDDADRSPKKQKAQVAEGAALVAPRLIATPKPKLSSAAASPKKGVLSMSRLNMLARPKMRK
ncbi:hypothetical protein M7I_7497 [Glarea lozoyensis 74030]|nr:hypothetical protein M7I_7497 [Glarea lozoyensis 74030]